MKMNFVKIKPFPFPLPQWAMVIAFLLYWVCYPEATSLWIQPSYIYITCCPRVVYCQTQWRIQGVSGSLRTRPPLKKSSSKIGYCDKIMSRGRGKPPLPILETPFVILQSPQSDPPLKTVQINDNLPKDNYVRSLSLMAGMEPYTQDEQLECPTK